MAKPAHKGMPNPTNSADTAAWKGDSGLPLSDRAELRVARCGGVRTGFLVVGTLAEPLPEDAWMLLLT
jgi:hypothetical protein